MKTLVLMWVLLQMLSLFAASDTNSNTNETYTLVNSNNLAKPDCLSRCGDLIIPYPFGIGFNSNCSIGPEFDVYCNLSSDPPRASITNTTYTSIKNISDSTLRTSNIVSTRCYFPNDTIQRDDRYNVSYRDWPYTISVINKLIVIGCNEYAWVTSDSKSIGCLVICYKEGDTPGEECSGHACCQSSLPQNINYYATQFYALQDSNFTNSNNGSLNPINNTITRPLLGEVIGMSSRQTLNPCTYAFVGYADEFKFKGETDLNDASLRQKIEASVPIVLEWAIGNLSCTEVEAKDGFACQGNSRCVNSLRESGGYRCICNDGYEGNPYLSPGCQDINECTKKEDFPCYGTCVNTPGNYTCKCKQGYSGDAKIEDGCSRKIPVLQLGLGIGLGFPAILIGIWVLYFTAKKRKLVKLREKFFEQNGGVLLQDKLKTKGGVGIGSMRIFQVKELEAATENFAEDRILGKGGNGIVYKGTLPDKCVVAIKKSQRLDQGQREQFINEMVILTQINHQNIVQLLGCCLESDIPLLVYEFVSNDTLSCHIHNQTSGLGRLSWNNRLRIAHESAGALAYLHTDARMSIIHRDVKSTNILLDENYTAKIADFGASRLVPLGHDQVTTLVQGTLGYLDPEYFHTGQLTDKSDVYSFGVVLAELLTGKKPINVERCLDERNLATYFVHAMKENQLLDILEHQLVNEATDEQLKATCYLACRCLNIASERRPSMKEVTMELESLRKFNKHPWDCKDMKYDMSSLMIEEEEGDLYTVPFITDSDTFGEYSSSSIRRKEC